MNNFKQQNNGSFCIGLWVYKTANDKTRSYQSDCERKPRKWAAIVNFINVWVF